MNANPTKAVITLYIDPGTYERESGEPLTANTLAVIASDVNNDAAPIHGYESYEFEFKEVGP